MTCLEMSENQKNKQKNYQPRRNPITLNGMMMNIWIKQTTDLGRGKDQLDENISSEPTKYVVYQMNRISFDKYNKTK